MSTTIERDIEHLRDELEGMQRRLRRLEIQAGVDVSGSIPQPRLEALVAAATGKPVRP